MNRTKLKNYAPQARRDFIQAMKDRAAYYGLTAKKTDPVVVKGDVAVIAGREHRRDVSKKRKLLVDRIKVHGFEQTMEAMAYTWFNRLVAIRFIEIHGYLGHGYRVLSHPEGKPTPEIVEQAEHVDLPGLKKETIIDLKLAENKESQLYRLLLTAQCNALHSAMPFLFEKIDDETELLLPDNLLHSDSLLRKLVNEIDEDDWKEVEIIGWLYQFYISEKKDKVIGKVVASEDIPAATQLFTPNWIVKYLVQNTLGRQWLATYPQSALRQQMEYYIEPAEQTPEVQEQLNAITPTSLNPEELTLLDPACGSGHILVEAYDLFQAIYQERGYRARDIPALILQKNLFGLEIDDRAAQLAAFALMMKARADDRRIFESEAKPNIVALQNSPTTDATELTDALNAPLIQEAEPSEYLFPEVQAEKDGLFAKPTHAEPGQIAQSDIAALLALFENAKIFGSLIQVPPTLAAKLPEIKQRLDEVLKGGDLTGSSVTELQPLLKQASMLSRQYDAVVANPPYMGGKHFNTWLKEYITKKYNTAKADLCVAFITRGMAFTMPSGQMGQVTMQSWMFLSSIEQFRASFLDRYTITTMAHLGPHAFPQIGGQIVQVTAFTASPSTLASFRGSYKRLVQGQSDDKRIGFKLSYSYTPVNHEFESIPGCPIAYWANRKAISTFQMFPSLSEIATPRAGMITSNNAIFVRLWHEIAIEKMGVKNESCEQARQSGKKWFPYQKGGVYRKWFGNNDYVVNWHNDGYDIKTRQDTFGRIPAHAFNEEYIFKPNVNWSAVTVSRFSVRITRKGSLFDAGGSAAFPNARDVNYLAGFLNSVISQYLIGILNPTVNFQAWDIAKLPVKQNEPAFHIVVSQTVDEAAFLAKKDWNAHETSWDFATLPIFQHKLATLQQAQEAADAECLSRFARMKQLEEENNRLFIDAYGLQDELSPEVPDDQITLYRPNRAEDIKRLLSYAVGCMMGRYRLDKPGLIYAHSGNEGFDHSQYTTFRADDDGIIPLLETDWGLRDDATDRLHKFIKVVWPNDPAAIEFIEVSLGTTIRDYLAKGFYKHHLSMYKKRPIYWLFASGKQRAFQSLVYLHRYHEGTLARMRTEYVIPLQGRMAARIEQLEGDKTNASSTSHRNTLQKEQDKLKKQQAELTTFEEKLKHAADQRIKLDLDDGVKVNYAKFGDLLAESKAITGTKDEE